MRVFTLFLAALVTVASAVAVPAAEPEPEAEAFFQAVGGNHATIPYINKRDEPPTPVKREPEFANKDAQFYTNVFNNYPKTKKRELTNVRPLLTRDSDPTLVKRYPNTPTTGANAGRCGAGYGYYCGPWDNPYGGCCGGAGTVAVSLTPIGNFNLICEVTELKLFHNATQSRCGTSELHCAGACQRNYGWCTDPNFQLAFDIDTGDVLWDPVTNTVFDAGMGDGFIIFGYGKKNQQKPPPARTLPYDVL